MKPGERMVWASVFAAYCNNPRPSREIGHVSRAQIVSDAAAEATSALAELRAAIGPADGARVWARGILAGAREVMNAEGAPGPRQLTCRARGAATTRPRS